MASLIDLQTNETINLSTQFIIGRHPKTSNLVLNNPKASRIHATIAWNGENWSIQDTSSNGTYLNGMRLMRGVGQPLQPGDNIYFTDPNNCGFKVQDIDPPKSMLIAQTANTTSIVLEDIVVLPNEEDPQVTLYLSDEGFWLCESEAGTAILADGDLIASEDDRWRFIDAQSCNETMCAVAPKTVTPDAIQLYFQVSQDEKQVTLDLKVNDRRIPLGKKNHHHLLMLLARQYIADKKSSLTPADSGWVNKQHLADSLQLNAPLINAQIYQIRKQVIKASCIDLILPQMIENRQNDIRLIYLNTNIESGLKHTIADDNKSDQIAM
jgi:hypothetical protein